MNQLDKCPAPRKPAHRPDKPSQELSGAVILAQTGYLLQCPRLNSFGAIVLRERVSPGRIASRLANLPPCLIGIEAGMATHYVARGLAALGHDVKQVPAMYAKPFRQGHKNDFRDAHAVAEAVQRPTTRFVPAKSDEQLDLQALHRVRSRLVSDRTAVINQIRAFFWNVASLCDKDCGSFASRSLTSWPSGRTFFPCAWCASSLILPTTGDGSMNGLKRSPMRSRR
jgi:hypothetical protein